MTEKDTYILDKLGVKVGLKVAHTKTITEEDLILFSRVTEDLHPVHVDAEYAQKTIFGGRVIHGAFTQALLQAAQSNLPGVVILLAQSTKFLKPVKIGDTITAIAEVTEARRDKGTITLKHTCVNQNREAVAEGEALVRLYEAPS